MRVLRVQLYLRGKQLFLLPALRGEDGRRAMIRIIIDIEDHGDKLATKESVAMALEQFGKVRVVMVTDGKEPKR